VQELAAIWSTLSLQRRAFLIFAAVALGAALMALSRAATAPSLTLLYSGLEAGAAGDVVGALDQRGVAYEVRGGAIYVDSARRDELRLTLASEGLPANGGAGYELLDTLSGFGTTSQMFDAAYWRAKEGELARTIASSPNIRSARVHIATPGNQGFRRDQLVTASVTLVPASEGIAPQQGRAVRFLVASAVAGLRPEDVSVIDAQSGLVIGVEDNMALSQGGGDRAAEIKRNVERLLEARVGPGRAVVELTIDTLTDREEITQRTFDPDTRIAISTENEERTTQSNDSRSSAVTVASNLPAGDASGAGGQSSSQNSETRARVNYEVSETNRAVLRVPGGIKRITVAVLVDGVRGTNSAGLATWEPRSDEEMAALRELVASAVGFDEARGDVITLKSMPFEPLPELGTAGAGSILDGINIMSAVQILVLALVALILGLFVVRPILTPRTLPALRDLSGGIAAGAGGAAPRELASLPGGGGFDLPIPSRLPEQGSALTGEIDDSDDFFSGGFGTMTPSLASLQGKSVVDDDYDPSDPVSRLRRLISERQEETVEILRNWMDDREEKV